ncbi:MAG: hypothetical protein Q9167_005654, partial [Letrouitia subvulpina]
MDQREYGGLEVDTRMKEGRDKQIDSSKPPPTLRKNEDEDHGRYLNEKQMIQAHEIPQSTPTSATSGSSMGSLGPNTPRLKTIEESIDSCPEPEDRRICGLRRRNFWVLFAVILVLVIVAAVVGGVVGGTRRSSSNPSSPNPANTPSPPSPPTTNTPVQPADVVAGSPLNLISYDLGGNGDPQSRQGFRIYYQSVLGNIKEAISTGLGTWSPANPIFTDATNNTGLATVTYLNSTHQTGQMFYIGTNGFLQEKRKAFDDNLFWEPGTLNSQNIALVGNISLPEKTRDPINNFDSYRMAAVYSVRFASGPGTRLFHHMQSLNGSTWVQEWIWTQSTDNWQKGQSISDVFPNSHLAATVDEENMLLRLYYSSGNLTLHEKWINISDPTSVYNDGISIPNYLPSNDVDLAATSNNGTIYLYHYSKIGVLGIRETAITSVPYSPNSASAQNVQESYNMTALIARPSFATVSGTSPYQPVGASKTVVEGDGFSPSIFVFWAEKVTGDNAAMQGSVTGYSQLNELSRAADSGSWPKSGQQVTIPLGNSNTFPSSTKK